MKSRIEKDKEFVEEMAVIGPVAEDEATKELLHAKDNILVYHTSKDNVILKIRSSYGIGGKEHAFVEIRKEEKKNFIYQRIQG